MPFEIDEQLLSGVALSPGKARLIAHKLMLYAQEIDEGV